MTTAAQLQALPVAELKHLAAQHGIPFSPRIGQDKLAARLAEYMTDQAKKPQERAVEQAGKQPPIKPAPKIHTEDEVRVLIEKYAAREGFEAVFPGDGTWIFRCRGAEDSGNLAIPSRVILMKAETVSRGRAAPRVIKGDGTYGTSYPDNIIVG